MELTRVGISLQELGQIMNFSGSKFLYLYVGVVMGCHKTMVYVKNLGEGTKNMANLPLVKGSFSLAHLTLF